MQNESNVEKMLRKVAECSSQILIKQRMIQEDEKNIYTYGFELFWSTFFCVCFIIAIACITGYWKQATIFILYFMPIRTFAGGYHAKSYRNCFLLTNLIAYGAIALAEICQILPLPRVGVLILYIAAYVYIWKKAPVVFKEHPVKIETVEKNKKYAHNLLILEAVLVAYLYLYDYGTVYVMIIATCIVAFMMFISIRREEHI